MKILKKTIIIILIVLVAIVTISGIAIYSVWHNELSSFASIKKIKDRNDEHKDGSIYEMKISGGYYFDDFLEQGGASNDEELIGFITNKITKGLIKMNIDQTDINCSAFTATLENGDNVFGRNYDFDKTNTGIVLTKPKGRHASISTIDFQFLGLDKNKDITSMMDKITALAAPYIPLDGINDAGVSVAIFMTMQGDGTAVATDQQTEKPDITSTTMIRMILDYADTVSEAIELVEKYDLHDSAGTSYHYMVADSTGKSAILEWVYGTDVTDNDGSLRELKVTYNDNDSHVGEIEGNANYQWVTNFIVNPGYYSTDDEKGGFDRYMTIYDQLKLNNGQIENEESAMDILASVGRRSYKEGNGVTVHSVVYNLTKKTSYWIGNEHFDEDDSKFYYSL